MLIPYKAHYEHFTGKLELLSHVARIFNSTV